MPGARHLDPVVSGEMLPRAVTRGISVPSARSLTYASLTSRRAGVIWGERQHGDWPGAVPFSTKTSPQSPTEAGTRWFMPDNFLFRSMGLAAVTATALTGAYTGLRQAKIEEAGRERARQDAGASYGTADIGGPFTLTNVASGRRFTDNDLRGKFALIYFGFTTCPDVCPAELEKMRIALNSLEKRGIGSSDITPVFITVDPERDSAKAVRDYLKPFHPRVVGLTGTRAQVDAVSKAYKVYAKKTTDDGDNYLVDHSIIMYLMSPDGKFLDFYGKHVSEAELEDSIASGIQDWREKSKGSDKKYAR